MQTNLAEFIKGTPEGLEAESILRTCVHCGFCTATCPTYQLLGDELDGPRGRIYLIKQVLEGRQATEKTRQHLDRCLTCRSCESTCPSGVQYGRLVDIGRHVVEAQVPRRGADRVVRWLLKEFVPRAGLFGAAMSMGRLVKPALPAMLKDKVPDARPAGAWPASRHSRKMIALAGCAQPSMAPSINAATARVLDALGISLVEMPGAGCCGAVRYHLNDQQGGLADARRNIDAWWPGVERGEIEAVVMTASGCGVQVKDYGHLLRGDHVQCQRFLQQQGLARRRRERYQPGLHVRRYGERDRVTPTEEVVEVVGGVGAVLLCQLPGGLDPPGVHHCQRRLRTRGEHRGVEDLGPRTGTDKTYAHWVHGTDCAGFSPQTNSRGSTRVSPGSPSKSESALKISPMPATRAVAAWTASRPPIRWRLISASASASTAWSKGCNRHVDATVCACSRALSRESTRIR